MKSKLHGLSTGIGSLPHSEAESALDLIANTFPELPHWPQLPKRSAKEGFVHQYLAPLINQGLIKHEGEQTPFFRTEDPQWLDLVTRFYETYLSIEEEADKLELFGFPQDSAAGFYSFIDRQKELAQRAMFWKGQISGPVTVGLGVTDAGKRASFYDDDLRDILLKTMTLQARWQLRLLKKHGVTPILFIDEPGLLAYGQSNYVALSKEAIQDSLNTLIDTIHEEGGLAGIHCCSGVDWSLFFETPVDIVSFDAWKHFPSMQVYTEALTSFLQNGGILAWGIVPASEEALNEDRDTLNGNLQEKIEKLSQQNVPPEILRKQILITPSCGAGTLDVDLSERIYGLTAELSNAWQ